MSIRTLLFFCLLYCLLFAFLYPWYQYVFDSDATGYLKVAERIAQGDFANSVNGYWSPLNCWFLVPFVKVGFNAVTSAKILNGFFGLGTLISIHFLLSKFELHKNTIIGIMFALVIMLLHFAFNQLFGDFLLVLVLTIYLNIICSENFIDSNRKIILSSIVCGVAYYAKYYTIYFGLAYMAVLLFFLLKEHELKFSIKTWLIKTAIAWSTILLIALPWVFALKNKYGNFVFTTSSRLNQTWYLSFGSFLQPRMLVSPLPYPDSYSNWDDPSFWPGIFINPFTNISVFFFQFKLIISNIQYYVHFLNDFSFIALFVFLLSSLLFFLKNKEFKKNKNNSLLLLIILIMPLGYFLVHIEPRFIWISYICLLILSGVLLTILDSKKWINSKVFLLVCVIIFGSFCLYPVNALQDQRNEGKQVYDMFNAFSKAGIKGKFISNFSTADQQSELTVLAYLLKSHFLSTDPTATESEALQIIKEYKIDYYVLFYSSTYQKDGILRSDIAKNSTSVLQDAYPGVIILSFKK
jgi:hypothetical protein